MLPAGLPAHREQRHAGLGGRLAQRVGLARGVQLDGDGGGPGPAGRAQRREGGPAPGADGEHEFARGGDGRVLGIEDGHVADRDVEAVRGGLELDQRLAQGHQQLPEREAGGGHRASSGVSDGWGGGGRRGSRGGERWRVVSEAGVGPG